MLPRGGDEASTERFWASVEERHGSPVLARGMASYVSGPHIETELWGLVYLVSDRLVFQHFAQANWFSALVTSPKTPEEEASRPPRERNIELQFLLADLRAVRITAPARGLRRLVVGSACRLTMEPRDGGESVELRVEHGAEELAEQLPRAFRAAAP